ncbi:carbohydrate kinase family protein [Nocardioides marmotae]|uniref:carbohydrate kinase family protein n=1 Tax=Nocardioides marmotae TaxID=2663857 RepID=UPI0012B6350A|nr:sugar kinase [Nocardioides marmotae]MBC9734843.1 sugar kinase [Nocardioides marmotae]MTB85944.1 carbohydrate kinase family protein [Nocardioides marmotae]
MKVATVGVHVLDTHVIGVESIPERSDGQLVERISLSPAGTAGGTGVVLSRLGAQVSAFGAVGEDPVATTLLALLGHEGVDVSGLVGKADAQTSASVIPVRPGGERPAWHCIGANGAFTLDDLDLGALEGITHLHLGGPEFLGGEAAGRLLAHARSLGATTSLDLLAPGDPDMLAWVADALPHTDHLLPNDEQVLGLTGAASLADGARTLLDHGVGTVAVTQGARGALVATAAETFEVPAYAVEVVDTTGCGDAFSAGYLRGLALGRDLRGAAELGCAVAAQVAQGLGTDAGSYTLASVEEFARTAPRR